jgi:hypothetical protein
MSEASRPQSPTLHPSEQLRLLLHESVKNPQRMGRGRTCLIWDFRSSFGTHPEELDLNTPPGSKVIYARTEAGYSIESSKEMLYPGNVYTVDHLEVGRSYTSVYLKEFPNQAFNSVVFLNWTPTAPRKLGPTIQTVQDYKNALTQELQKQIKLLGQLSESLKKNTGNPQADLQGFIDQHTHDASLLAVMLAVIAQDRPDWGEASRTVFQQGVDAIRAEDDARAARNPDEEEIVEE